MQRKPLRASPALRCPWRNRPLPTRSLKSLFPRPMSPHRAGRGPGRRLPNPPNLQRCPRPPNLRRCRKSRKEERRKQRRWKSRRHPRNPPALQRSSPMRRTSWVKWINQKRQRWAGDSVAAGSRSISSLCFSPGSSVVVTICSCVSRLLRTSWVCQKRRRQSRTAWTSLKSGSRIKTRPKLSGSIRYDHFIRLMTY